MAAFEWSLTNILTVVCIVYVCLIPAVTSQSGAVFSVIVQDSLSMNNFSFDSKGFTALYQCLCSSNYDACQTTPLSDDLKDVRGCPHTNSGSSGNMYTQCKISTDVTCSRKDLGTIKCNQTIPKNVVICDSVQLEWNVNRKIALQSHTKNIDISRCSRYKPNCIYLITTNVNSYEQRDEPLIVEVNATAPGTTPSSNPAATLSPTTSRSSDPTASSSPTPDGASSVKAENDSDDDIPIIIGVIVGVLVVVAIIVIIVVVLWKRKKKSPSSPGINNNNNNNNNNSNSNNNDSQLEDTDISPYATYSMSNVRPNQYSTNQNNKLNTTTTSLNSNNDNTNPNQATPDVYATVDLSKKQKKTAASPDNNNDDSNSETSSRQKKRKSNRNLDYEDVNMDNGAGYYYSSSDVLNDQSSANSPPNSSAKPKSYDVYSESGEEPSAAYAQVLKKDKSKNKSAESEERAGPSRSYDNSGYEFVTIGTSKESSL